MSDNANVFRSDQRELTKEEATLVLEIKNTAQSLYNRVDQMVDGREKTLAKTKLEESVMWSVKGITG